MRMYTSSLVLCGALVGLCGTSLVRAEQQTLPVKAVSQAPSLVRQVKVVSSQAPDTSSLKSIVQSVTRDCKTNDEKAVAIYNVNQLLNYHRAYPEEPGLVSALKEFNVYGWSLCGGLHTEQSALWREAGWKWRYLGWPGHTTVEAFYDGQWHYIDIFLKYYAWKPDPKAPHGMTIASQEDIAKNPDLVLADLAEDKDRSVMFSKFDNLQKVGDKLNWTAQPMLVCGDEAKGVVAGCKARNMVGSPTEWASIRFDDPNYSTDVNLAPGYSLSLTWDAIPGAFFWRTEGKISEVAPGHTCGAGDKDYRNTPSVGPILEPYIKSGGQRRSYANGTLLFAPSLANNAFLAGLAARQNVKVADGQLLPAEAGKPASITVELQSPYVMVQAKGQAQGAKAQLSFDGGKTFNDVDLADFSETVKGHYQALVKLTFDKPLKALQLEAIVQHNRSALPYLAPGKNKITVTAADAKALGENRLVVTYAYRTGYHDKSFEEIAAKGGRVGSAAGAIWSDTPTVVQKTFTAKDLPATFEIDVPTPNGKHPAYPRMMLLRREVLAAGQKALPLPENSVEPKVGPNDTLVSLPNPWLMGGQPATADKPAPVQAAR